MRFQYRIDSGTPVAPLTAVPSCTRCAAPPRTKARATRRAGPLVSGAVAGAAMLAIAGCASFDATVAKAWKIEPALDVRHSMHSSEAYYTLGKYFDGSRDWNKAIDAYRHAIAVDGRHVEAYNALGVALAQSGRLAEAETTLRQAVALDPSRGHVLSNLGLVLFLEGRMDDAVTTLRAAVDRDGGDTTATSNLRLAMARVGARAGPVAVVGKPVQDAPAAQPAAPAAVQTASLKVGFGPGLAPSVNAPATEVDSVVAPDRVEASAVEATPVVAPAVATAPTAALAPPSARLEISNGNGVTGMAARVGRLLARQGIATQRLTNQRPFAQALTIVQYGAGHEEAAQRIARSMPAEARADTKPTPGLHSDVRVVLGHDWVKAAACLATDSCPAGTGAIALADR
ncbi:MAG TPA: tetratricopeptide repeat protein [Albitalea sp.]|uniref:LytR C-terminal domain-containing protein n=1 Tax=Piscinibacter sp. TaxID=1903157 RepID=UPI002ED2E871